MRRHPLVIAASAAAVVTLLALWVARTLPNAEAAAGEYLPWRTLVAVAEPGGTVFTYRTEDTDPADIEHLGSIGAAGARDVVVLPGDDAVFVLGGPAETDPATVRRYSVLADGELRNPTSAVEVGVGATSLALSPDARHLYTVNPASDSITSLDTVLGVVEHSYSIPETPVEMVITQDGLNAVVLDEAGGLSLLDLVAGTVVYREVFGSGDIAALALARGLSPNGDDPDYAVVFLADRGEPAIRSIAVAPWLATPLVLSQNLFLGGSGAVPTALAVSAGDGSLWVADSANARLVKYDYDAAGSSLGGAGLAVDLGDDFGSNFVLDPNGEFAEVQVEGTATVRRFRLSDGDLVGTLATFPSASLSLVTTPVQAVTVTLEHESWWSVMRDTPTTITAVPSDPGRVDHYVWDFHDGTGPIVTTVPEVEHTWDVEGRYEVSVVAVTDPGDDVFTDGFSTQDVYLGQQVALHGAPEARASRIMDVGFPTGGSGVSVVAPYSLANTPDGYAEFTVPTGITDIQITLAGAAGEAGDPTAGDDFCNALGDDWDCSNDGYGEGNNVVANVTVPVGPDEVVREGDTLAVVIGSTTDATHGYLLGGAGGEGAGTGGNGGHGGGGSGVFVLDSARGNPWVIVAPGSGGGGGGGFAKHSGSMGGRADFNAANDGDHENGVCPAGAGTGSGGQHGGDGEDAGGGGVTGGGGGAGGGCYAGDGGPAGGEGQGGEGGGGGNGYSVYPFTLTCISSTNYGNVCDDSFVRIVGTSSSDPRLTTPTPDPTFAFDPVARFAVGSPGSFPLPVGFAAYGATIIEPTGLPDGLKWLCYGNGTCAILGTPQPGSGGEYDIELDLVTDGQGPTTVRLVVEETPAFTEAPPAASTLRPGEAVSFDVATVGMDGRRLGLRGALPAGLRLVDNGDGNGTISGTVEPGSDGTYPLRLVVAQDARSLTDERLSAAYHDFVLRVASGPDLAIEVDHAASFTAGSEDQEIVLTVSNVGLDPTDGGEATVSYALASPTGLDPTAISGAGWTCTLATLTCTRSDVLDDGAAYPPITITTNVLVGVGPGTTENRASVSTALDTDAGNNVVTDPITITEEPPTGGPTTAGPTETPGPTASLPGTGQPLAGVIIAGAALVIAGAVVLGVLHRRRRRPDLEA